MNESLTIKKRQSSSASQFVEATATLLSQRTSLEVSLSEISKRAGFNSALIKYHFGNKEGLLLAVLERDAQKAMKALSHLVEMPISAGEKLRIHISGIINAYYISPYLNRLIHHMINSTDEDASRRVVEMFIEPMLGAYRAIIDQGVKDGTFRSVDPAFLYYSVVGACDHIFHASYSVKSILGTPGMTEGLKQSYITHVVNMCLNGVLKSN